MAFFSVKMHEKVFLSFLCAAFYSIQWIRKLIFIPPCSISKGSLHAAKVILKAFKLIKMLQFLPCYLLSTFQKEIYSNKKEEKWKSFKPLKFVGKCNSCTSRNGWEKEKNEIPFYRHKLLQQFSTSCKKKFFFVFISTNFLQAHIQGHSTNCT